MEFIKVHSGGVYFLAFMAMMVMIEAIWLITTIRRKYDWRETLASFGVAIGKRVVDVATAGTAAAILFWFYSFRIFTLDLKSLPNILFFFLMYEFLYYWHHRMAHEIRWLWATHSVHHSPEEMNLSVSVRIGWTGLLSGSIFFFAPLAIIGFHPFAVFFTLAASLFYQIWIHTELVKKLPRPIEWLFNTPSHHRVHHGSNDEYLDRNYGGVLIIWDRIFGTFTEEITRPNYGLSTPINSYNPFKIALFEWGKMFRDALSARSVRTFFSFLFGPPGWRPENPKSLNQKITNNPLKTSKD